MGSEERESGLRRGGRVNRAFCLRNEGNEKREREREVVRGEGERDPCTLYSQGTQNLMVQ